MEGLAQALANGSASGGMAPPAEMPEALIAKEVLSTSKDAPETPEVKEPAPEAEKEDEAFSPKFAALTRKAKQAEAAKAEAKTLMAQVQAEREKIKSDLEEVKKYKESKESYRSNIGKLLQDHGLSFDDVKAWQENGGKVTPELKTRELESKWERFQREQEEKEAQKIKLEAESAEKAHKEALDKLRSDISSFTESNTEKYELINLHEASSLVFQTIEAHFAETQKVLSVEEASDLVEKYLESQIERSLSTKKLQSKFSSKASEPEKEDKSKPAATTAKTLASAITASPASTSKPVLTEDERMKRALAKMDW